MKKASIKLTIAIVLIAQAVTAQTVHVCLSPRMDQADLETFLNVHNTWLLNDAPPGLKLRYVDGEKLKSIAEITIPNESYAAARADALKKGLAGLSVWINTTLKSKNAKDGRMNVPRLFDELSRDLEQGSVVLLCGSAVYRNETEPSFSFVQPGKNQPVVPIDGLLATTIGISPFAMIERKGQLKGVRVHWWTPDATDMGTDLTYARIKRFWTLLVSLQNGQFIDLTTDTRAIHGRLLRADLAPLTAKLDPSQVDQVMMEKLRKARLISETATEGVVDFDSFKELPKFSQVLLIDRTSSMGSKFSDVAAYVSLLPTTEWYGLYIYGDYSDTPPASLFREGDDPSLMAKALREIKLTPGGDVPECLEEALHMAYRELLRREVKNANITIFTDAPPHEPEDSPNARDYRAIIHKLLADGHRINLIRCHHRQETKWVPSGVKIGTLPSAR